MPLITDRQQVLDIYAEAAQRGWVTPCFATENLTTIEAVLTGTRQRGEALGIDDLPITLTVTNQYPYRTNSAHYTHTRRWDVGLRLFLADLEILAGADSPFGRLRVMVHLDHTQYDADRELLDWDMSQFSSLMFDASKLPLGENIRVTRRFVEARGRQIVVEGACDEIVDAVPGRLALPNTLTTPDDAERYLAETGVDFIVANLGTEHRASAANRKYHGALARQIAARVGPRLVLHGCSSVPPRQLCNLWADGVCKVNIWTTLERDSAPALLEQMTAHAAKIVGSQRACQLHACGLLGNDCDLDSEPALTHYTTSWRQSVIFQEMSRIVAAFLEMWYR